MKKALVVLAGLLMVPVMALGIAAVAPAGEVHAQVLDGLRKTQAAGGTQADADTLITNVINFLLMAVVVVAVIMLIIGGFKYVTSNGDSNSVTAAKNTIMYAIIGLVVAIFAYAIVAFVLKQFGIS